MPQHTERERRRRARQTGLPALAGGAAAASAFGPIEPVPFRPVGVPTAGQLSPQEVALQQGASSGLVDAVQAGRRHGFARDAIQPFRDTNAQFAPLPQVDREPFLPTDTNLPSRPGLTQEDIDAADIDFFQRNRFAASGGGRDAFGLPSRDPFDNLALQRFTTAQMQAGATLPVADQAAIAERQRLAAEATGIDLGSSQTAAAAARGTPEQPGLPRVFSPKDEELLNLTSEGRAILRKGGVPILQRTRPGRTEEDRQASIARREAKTQKREDGIAIRSLGKQGIPPEQARGLLPVVRGEREARPREVMQLLGPERGLPVLQHMAETNPVKLRAEALSQALPLVTDPAMLEPVTRAIIEGISGEESDIPQLFPGDPLGTAAVETEGFPADTTRSLSAAVKEGDWETIMRIRRSHPEVSDGTWNRMLSQANEGGSVENPSGGAIRGALGSAGRGLGSLFDPENFLPRLPTGLADEQRGRLEDLEILARDGDPGARAILEAERERSKPRTPPLPFNPLLTVRGLPGI